MPYVPFGPLPNNVKANDMAQLVHDVLKKDDTPWWRNLSHVVKRNKLQLRHSYSEERSLLATHISCFQDSVLVKLAKQVGLPRGFVLIIDVEEKALVGSGTFYPKFANDSRQQNIDDVYNVDVHRLSFYIKYSGSLGITSIFKHRGEVCYTVSSKNSCDAVPPPNRNSFPLLGHGVMKEKLSQDTLEKLWERGITTIGSENFYDNDCSHGYSYHKSGFIVTSMSRLWAEDGTKKITYLAPTELYDTCVQLGLPADNPCILDRPDRILPFLSAIAKHRNVLTLTLLEEALRQLPDDVQLETNHRDLVRGDIIEGFVIRRWRGEKELPSIKYKCWPYQMVTQCLRPFMTYQKNSLDYRQDLQPIRKVGSDGEVSVPRQFYQLVEKALQQWCVFTSKQSKADADVPLQRTICRWLLYRAAQMSKASAAPLTWKEEYGEAYWSRLGREVVNEFVEAMKAVEWDMTRFCPTNPTLSEVSSHAGEVLHEEQPPYVPGQLAVLVPVGVPGIGKSVVLRTLQRAYSSHVHYDTQDNHNNFTGFINSHLKRTGSYVGAKGRKYLLIADRNNHTETLRNAVTQAFAKPFPSAKAKGDDLALETPLDKARRLPPYTVVVNFAGVWDAEGTVCDLDRDSEKLFDVATERMQQRGTGHQSICDPYTGRRIVRRFLEEFEPPMNPLMLAPPINLGVAEKALYLINALSDLGILPPPESLHTAAEKGDDDDDDDDEDSGDARAPAPPTVGTPSLAELEAHYQAVMDVERKRTPKYSPLIDTAAFDDSAVETIEAIAEAQGLQLTKEEFHTTLAFYPEDNGLETSIVGHLGKELPCKLLNYVKDDKGAAIEVQLVADSLEGLPVKPDKRYHITLWNADGVKPVYSNELLALKGSPGVTVVPLEGTVVGTITRRYNKDVKKSPSKEKEKESGGGGGGRKGKKSAEDRAAEKAEKQARKDARQQAKQEKRNRRKEAAEDGTAADDASHHGDSVNPFAALE